MGRINRHGQLRKKIARNKTFKPEVTVDHDADFASIRIASGVESKSYVKDGFVFCEDKNGRIIEVQILNLSDLAKKKSPSAA